MDLEWEEPPPTKRGPQSGEWAAIAEALRKAPGRWAIVYTADQQNVVGARARSVKNGEYVAFRPAGSFEAVSRSVDGEHRVYARYVGEQPL